MENREYLNERRQEKSLKYRKLKEQNRKRTVQVKGVVK